MSTLQTHSQTEDLMTVYTTDDIVHPKSSLPFIDRVGSVDAINLLVPTGHMGVVVSSVAYKRLWPQVNTWLRERDEQGVPTTTVSH